MFTRKKKISRLIGSDFFIFLRDTLILLLFLALGVWLVLYGLTLSKPEQGDFIPIPEDEGESIMASFTDIFSGFAWLNAEETTMAHDSRAMAFTFPPVFEWQRISPGDYDFKTSDVYSGALPQAVQGVDIYSSRATGLEDMEIVGFVVSRDGEYFGLVYEITDGGFREIFGFEDTPFVSEEAGALGFGGSRENWLAVYGSSDGMVVQVLGGEVFDISHILTRRTMDGGFEPAVIKSGDWYVWSAGGGRAKLVKFVQDSFGRIYGTVDFTDKLSLFEYHSASFSAGNGSQRELVAKLDDEFWRFRDLGFDKSSSREIVSSNINTYSGRVAFGLIEDLGFSSVGGRAKFELSNDGATWQNAEIGEEVVFENQGGSLLLWRMFVEPVGDNFVSPVFHSINLNYYAIIQP